MKIMKYTILVFSTIILLANCCENMMEKWFYIRVANISQKAIMVTAGYERFLMNAYPDTTLPSSEPDLYKIEPNKQINLRSGFEWEKVIEEMPLDTLSIYVFDADTLNTYDWIQVKEGYKVLKRYDLSLDDLRKMNWTITYP